MRLTIQKFVAIAAPCVALLGVASPAAAGTTCQNLWCQSGESWSNGSFGASYSLWTGIETKRDHAADPAYDALYFKLGAELSATAKALGKGMTIAEAYALGENHQGVSSARYKVAAVGIVLLEGEVSNQFTWEIDRTFFRADADIKLLGVGIDLDGKVAGQLGLTITPTPTTNGMQLSVIPSAAAYADVDAHVGAACASVGVSGSLTALDLSIPTTAKVDFSGGKLNYGLLNYFSLHSLDGKLRVKLSYCASSDSKTLVNFDGYTIDKSLFFTGGSLPL